MEQFAEGQPQCPLLRRELQVALATGFSTWWGSKGILWRHDNQSSLSSSPVLNQSTIYILLDPKLELANNKPILHQTNLGDPNSSCTTAERFLSPVSELALALYKRVGRVGLLWGGGKLYMCIYADINTYTYMCNKIRGSD